SKLAGVQAAATANATNAQLRDRSTHTGTQAIGTVSGLQGALDGKVGTGDSRLANAREWTADTVGQVEAEAGTGTTRRAWTAQRVRQAIEARIAGLGTNAVGNRTISTANPSGGQDGDIWYKVV